MKEFHFVTPSGSALLVLIEKGGNLRGCQLRKVTDRVSCKVSNGLQEMVIDSVSSFPRKLELILC